MRVVRPRRRRAYKAGAPLRRESLTIELVGPGPTSGSSNYYKPVANSWPVVLLAPDHEAPCRKLQLPEKGRVQDFSNRSVDGDVFNTWGWAAHGSALGEYPFDPETGGRTKHAWDEPQWLEFDDDAKVAIDDLDHAKFSTGGTYRPVDSLSEFEGAVANGNGRCELRTTAGRTRRPGTSPSGN